MLKKSFWKWNPKVHANHEKVYSENERNKGRKNNGHLKIILFKGTAVLYMAVSEDLLNQFRWALGFDSSNNKGTNTVVMSNSEIVCVWAHQRVPLNPQWLVLKNFCTDFHHCWIIDSI